PHEVGGRSLPPELAEAGGKGQRVRLCPPRSGGRSLPPELAEAGGKGQSVGDGFARPFGPPPTPLRGGPFPPRFAPGDKAMDFVPHEGGEGPCRRSLRRREVGGKR